MFKRTSINAAYSAIVFTMLCLFPVGVGLTAQAQQPQEGAINTSRSNIKNTSRHAGGRFDPIQLDLMKASGEKVVTRQITDADNDGMISEQEVAFDFGVLPAGDYVLKFTIPDKKQKNPGRLDSKIDSADGKKASETAKHDADVDRLQVTLNGVVGGTLKHELKSDLTSELGSVTARAGKPKFKNVTFKANGNSVVNGLATRSGYQRN